MCDILLTTCPALLLLLLALHLLYVLWCVLCDNNCAVPLTLNAEHSKDWCRLRRHGVQKDGPQHRQHRHSHGNKRHTCWALHTSVYMKSATQNTKLTATRYPPHPQSHSHRDHRDTRYDDRASRDDNKTESQLIVSRPANGRHTRARAICAIPNATTSLR